ncbi:MAG: tetratricopeptide repeat protein [Spirochaetaceae bacterium]|jgi:tetratricopeptide (TPR) repeat protein|nr:tetratricopeptide repeat protein [Spirochaetaceae bacterium]
MIQKMPMAFLTLLFFWGSGPGFTQGRPTSPEELLKTGISFYGEGKFDQSLTLLRLIGPETGGALYAETLYWTSLAELSSGRYDEALADLEKLEKAGGDRSGEIPYHRGRCYFYQGRYKEALLAFTDSMEGLEEQDPRKAASYYWMGESLFALGQLDGAADVFSLVVEKYPSSVKYEAASYRLDLINQKKIETELLGILKWSHEESLKTLEEYQTREKTYDQAIVIYQQKVAEMLAGAGTAVAESDTAYKSRLAEAEIRIAALEASLNEANAALIELQGSGVSFSGLGPLTETERALKLMELKAAALELINALNKRLTGDEI